MPHRSAIHEAVLRPVDALAASDRRSSSLPVPHATPAVQVIRSAQLFGENCVVHIAHGDATYCLRKTSLGKLILTK